VYGKRRGSENYQTIRPALLPRLPTGGQHAREETAIELEHTIKERSEVIGEDSPVDDVVRNP
jgi:hypothetical protein